MSSHRPRSLRKRWLFGASLATGVALLVGATAATSFAEGNDASDRATDQFNRLAADITAAFQTAEAEGGDPAVFVSSLPDEITTIDPSSFAAVLAGDDTTVASLVPGVADGVGALGDGEGPSVDWTVASSSSPSRLFSELVARVAPAVDSADAHAEVAAALALEDSEIPPSTDDPTGTASDSSGVSSTATRALFGGWFLHPENTGPFGTWAANCENHFCVPDRILDDYSKTDQFPDLSQGDYCSGVPDFWFKWPCYQHDKMYEFAPKVTSGLGTTFLAINTQWYSDMRTECHERIRLDWANPAFILCQAVALTYFVFVTGFSYPIFAQANKIPGYDVTGDESADRHQHAPVYRRWHACTGRYTTSAPFVSYNRRVLNGSASVPRGAVLELSGRVHRETAILFEFLRADGSVAANYLTTTAGDNCIIRQESNRFDTNTLESGTYQVVATFYDWQGNGGRLDHSYEPPRPVAYGHEVRRAEAIRLTIS